MRKKRRKKIIEPFSKTEKEKPRKLKAVRLLEIVLGQFCFTIVGLMN